jgi:hypothetical protein
MIKQMRLKLLFVVMLFVTLFAGWSVKSANAHTRVEIGPYAVVVGWLVEPPVIGERNAVIVEVHEIDGNVPVIGVDATLDAEFVYGGQVFRANLNPTETPGLYTAEIFPTVRGQYAVRLFGSIEDLEIDDVLEPEEVFPASRIQFPEAQPEPRELQQQIVELQADFQSARTLAMVGLGVGIMGLIVGAFAIVSGRKR